MGRILRKKPTSLKKRKRQDEDSGTPEANAPAEGTAAGSVAAAGEAAEPKPKPVLVAKKPGPPSGPASLSPPADNVFTRAIQFLREVKIELKKVTWPSRKQTMGSTLVVIVLVIIISLFLGIVDMGLSTVIRSVFR
ncbi:MAG TPA: preprotein translocase subunit SecE [Desulfobacterales bacterium]|jgi:preprotein translocase subunit SecE|nr:preprotein translocase subunit SecE [Desulfobacterales bacterium]HSM90809.1 preprotein translocase subunit SecE [Desulfobacterales bacterium]